MIGCSSQLTQNMQQLGTFIVFRQIQSVPIKKLIRIITYRHQLTSKNLTFGRNNKRFTRILLKYKRHN